MTGTKNHRGIVAPVVTPVRKRLGPDRDRWTRRVSEVVQRVGAERSRLSPRHDPPAARAPASLVEA